MKGEHSLSRLCQSFGVSRSGYYAWRQGQAQPGPRRQADQRLSVEIRRIYEDHRQTYGSPRIQRELRDAGQRHGRNRISRLMRAQQICGRPKRRFRPQTTQSTHDQPIAPNRLAERTPPRGPNEVWVGDITYIPTDQGWLYLAGILDLYSRRMVGWAMGSRLDADLVLDAWNMALRQRQPPAGLLFHSDRGVQYASGRYRQALAAAQAVASMSRKARCYDNAVMEAFWSTLKLDLVYRQNLATHQQARHALFDYIEVFYNRRRRHSSLNYLTPAAFESATN